MKVKIFLLFVLLFLSMGVNDVFAQGISVEMDLGDKELTSPLKVFLMMTILALAPSFLIMFTCFTHIIIVLGLTRQALGTMTLPPNQVLTGLALFLTIFIMMPVIQDVKEVAYTPYEKEEITFQEMIQRAEEPIKEFMIKNTYTDDLKAFVTLKGDEKPTSPEEVSIWSAAPAYSLSQISKGMFTGLMIYAAFAFIDILVGSILMFMGMFMLPPQMISLPLKLLVFVFIGGFTQIIEVLFGSIST
jgi:flagellar biosynthesis protein FliP